MQTFRRFLRPAYALCGACFAVLVLGANPASAQSGGGAASGDGMRFQKGTVELGWIGGSTLPVSWLRAHADRRITMVSLDVGRVMTTRRGPGPLAGNFEILLEITPLLVVQQPARSFGLTASPLHLRWNFAPRPNHGVRPFAEVSGGVVYTNHPVPVRATSSFNFIDQAGFGVRFGNNVRRAWLAGYRFQHISNAGRVEPNPGANFNFVYFGMMFLR